MLFVFNLAASGGAREEPAGVPPKMSVGNGGDSVCQQNFAPLLDDCHCELSQMPLSNDKWVTSAPDSSPGLTLTLMLRASMDKYPNIPTHGKPISQHTELIYELVAVLGPAFYL